MTGKPYNSEFGLPLDGFLHAACPHYWKYSEQNESEEEFTKRMGEDLENLIQKEGADTCLLYTSPSPRDKRQSRMPSSA